MPRRYRHKRDPLTQYDSNRLQNECRTLREKLVVWTLLDTGLRVEEFCSLDKKNMDWNNHRLTVWGKNTTGEGGKIRRDVHLTDRIRPLVETWLAQNDKMDITCRTAQRIVRRVANRVCIGKCSPHVLRHTFAVHSLERGIPITALSKMLGHARLETTLIYLNLSNEEAIRIYEEKW